MRDTPFPDPGHASELAWAYRTSCGRASVLEAETNWWP